MLVWKINVFFGAQEMTGLTRFIKLWLKVKI